MSLEGEQPCIKAEARLQSSDNLRDWKWLNASYHACLLLYEFHSAFTVMEYITHLGSGLSSPNSQHEFQLDESLEYVRDIGISDSDSSRR